MLCYTRSNMDDNDNTHIPQSLVMSSQVGTTSSPVSDDPVVLEFRYSAVSYFITMALMIIIKSMTKYYCG